MRLRAATTSHLSRRAKETLLKDWTVQWHRTLPAIVFPLKPRKLFAVTGREVHGRLVQCRAGHAFTGERRRFLRSLDPSCPCICPLQSHAQLLQDCIEHDDARSALFDSDIHMSLPGIPGMMPAGIQLALKPSRGRPLLRSLQEALAPIFLFLFFSRFILHHAFPFN